MLRFLKRHQKKIIIFIIICILMAVLPLLIIFLKTHNKIYTRTEAPEKPVAIVFGAAVFGKYTPSDVTADRVQTAVDLYKDGKVEKILMSGDNSLVNYNEPIVMKNYAVELGVPEEDIYLDYAGFRTYDTCARAKKIFGVDSALLVSQKFHLPRCIFICESFGIDSAGVIADKHIYLYWLRQNVREVLGKIVTVYEVYVFPHNPKFLGKEEADL